MSDPQDLVDRYGIRAYVGEPVRIGGVVVGSLCGIDTTPRVFSPEERALLQRMAHQVSARMEALASQRASAPAPLLSRAAEPAFAELRNIVSPLVSNLAMARVAIADLAPLARLSETLPTTAAVEIPAFGALRRAGAALEDLATILDELGESSRRLMPMLRAIERLVLIDGTAVLVTDVVAAGSQLAFHHTKLVGGVRWSPRSPEAELWTSRVVAVSAISAALSVLAAAMMPLGSGVGIDGLVDRSSDRMIISLCSPALGPSVFGEAATVLAELLSGNTSVAVTAAPDRLELRFLINVGRGEDLPSRETNG